MRLSTSERRRYADETVDVLLTSPIECTFVKAITNLVPRVFSTFQHCKLEETLDGLTLLLIGQVPREYNADWLY